MRLNLLKSKIKTYSENKEMVLTSLFFVIIFAIFFVNTLHETYPDEFDNIMGGWLNLHGKLIYKDWFTHHGPFAYWLASIIEIFSGQSFVKFRYLYSIFLFFLTFGGYYYLRKTFKFEKIKFYLGFILLLSIASTYFWGHMLLADSLSAFLLAPVFGLLVLKLYYNQALRYRDIIFISLFCSMALLTSMTFSYLVAGVYLLTLFQFLFFPHGTKSFRLSKIYSLLIILMPFLIYLVYLVITGSLGDYIYQAIKFNQQFYIYNYPRPEGVTTINPVRYAIVIAHDFYIHFASLLTQARDFNFQYPFNVTLVVVNTALIIFLLIKRKFLLAGFILYWLIYSNARSNPLISKETDYQSAVYFIASFFNICFSIYVIFDYLKDENQFPKKLVTSFLYLIILIYSFFTLVYLLNGFTFKAYNKFMGFSPTIYDRPKIAPVLNKITNPNDYVWVGPFDFEEIYYLNRKIPTNYVILLPEFAKSPKIQEKMMMDMNKNKPKVIYYDKQYSIRGYRPEVYAGFFQEFLDKNYVTLDELNAGQKIYSSNAYKDGHVDFETKLYIKKENLNEVIEKLKSENIITVKN